MRSIRRTASSARTLERRWEEALRREQELREEYDRFRRESPRRLTPEELDRIRALAADIPSQWHAAETSVADRKEIIRALVERVTVSDAGDSKSVLVHIRWMGGTCTEHPLRRPISHYERLADFPRIKRLVEAAVAAGQTSCGDRGMPQSRGFPPAVESRGPIHAGACQGPGLPTGPEPEATTSRGAGGRRMVAPRPGGRARRGIRPIQGMGQEGLCPRATRREPEASGDLGRCRGAGTAPPAPGRFPSRPDEPLSR